MRYLITGAKGFIGRNLVARLRQEGGDNLYCYDIDNSPEELEEWLLKCDGIFHLAGVNRPKQESEFEPGNAGFTAHILHILEIRKRQPAFVMTSSIQAEKASPYGTSKLHAEQSLASFADARRLPAATCRLKNVFGKWCRPNYNSVVATFCHNIANDLSIEISDPSKDIELVYIDDVVSMLIESMRQLLAGGNPVGDSSNYVIKDNMPSHHISLGDLAGRLQFFHEMNESLLIPDFAVTFNRQLYATYLSFVPQQHWQYGLNVKSDERGSLAEFLKSSHFGQLFVSRTRPGITRGNHYHHTKTEKFLVVHGRGLIRLRNVGGVETHEVVADGQRYQPVDIPPGYTHSITNIGDGEMVTLFWASEAFDPDRPDTTYLEVSEMSKSEPIQ